MLLGQKLLIVKVDPVTAGSRTLNSGGRGHATRGILDRGDRYVVQNAEDFYGPPNASGIYKGQPLELPMVSITPPSPVGVVTTQPAPVTGPTFDVFVLMKTGRGRCAPFSGEGKDAVTLDDAVVAGLCQPSVLSPRM
jgi:hypothetical protein